MSRRISAYIATVFIALVGFTGSLSHAQSLSAGAAFSSLKGSTTIDSGGSIHSQTRSIYSFGGGMTTFTGKKVTFLAVDPPSYSAGCAGISWHFGGFAFISMDELRQLVEAISQAALGIAVDLAIQTLCPQCYAVMSKLRDMANMMRNAAADACKIAKNMGRMLGAAMGLPEEKQTACSETTGNDGKTSGFLDSMAGKACRSLQAVNKFLDEEGSKVLQFLNGDISSGRTPNQDMLSKNFNVQYEILSALGLQDGVVKDLLLNYTGMTIYYPKPVEDCSAVLKNMKTSTDYKTGASAVDLSMVQGRGQKPVDPTKEGDETKKATPDKAGEVKSNHTCHLPPRMPKLEDMHKLLICGFDPYRDAQVFGRRFAFTDGELAQTSMGIMCGVKDLTNTPSKLAKEYGDRLLYSCDAKKSADGKSESRCIVPDEKRYSQLAEASGAYYTGLGWMIADALYMGVLKVALNQPLNQDTIQILNGSNYPLYRLINMAAVYPGMATQLLDTYASTIAVQYTVDLIDRLARPGAFPTMEKKGSLATIDFKDINELRSMITTLFRDGKSLRDETMKLMAEKRALVQTIVNINRALQADVISQGLVGNEAFALSIKKQLELAAP